MRPGTIPLGGLNDLLPQRSPAEQAAPSPNPEIAANATAVVESAPTETSTAEEDGSPAPVAGTESADEVAAAWVARWNEDRKSTRLNSSHANISYAVFCLK